MPKEAVRAKTLRLDEAYREWRDAGADGNRDADAGTLELLPYMLIGLAA